MGEATLAQGLGSVNVRSPARTEESSRRIAGIALPLAAVRLPTREVRAETVEVQVTPQKRRAVVEGRASETLFKEEISR
jgi:hypothetical protein